ncbi:hypothetical protein Taro_017397 [Colocasia esculenta]|uniref:Uncharacterized protein n=1 Tax=Colocasia esculenta TaxID=4460 RepID=A0A843UN02_COLES|nr:hypothetical protein [Colocasia esculenta]
MWWGDGGRCYWGRREESRAEGIVVVFAWMSSEDKHLKPYVRLYGSHGWDSLVCHADFLNMFFPEKATSLASIVLRELVKIIDGKCQGLLDQDECELLKGCICGQMYDSSPVDFTSDLGTRFVLHPTVLGMSEPPRVVSWMAKMFASSLDTLFLSRFEAQRAEYWQTLYSSVNMGPVLIFCSEGDELAPYHIVYNFAQRMQDQGGDVKLVTWNSSPHVGHYKQYPDEYRAATFELLSKAFIFYSQRVQLNGTTFGMGGDGDQISESICDLHRAAVSSNESLRRVATGPSDHFFLPSSVEYLETKDAGTIQDEQKGGLFHLQNPPAINPHGVLGQILFDVCVPKNVEGWDIKPMTVSSTRRHGPFNPMKCIRRCRL